jgi:hypothetical protein
VNVIVNGSDIHGGDITFSFDPVAFTIREMRDGGFLSRDGQIVSSVERIETASGTATISLDRQVGAPALSGGGNLVTLVLEPGAPSGDAVLRVTDFRVRNAQQVAQTGRTAEVRVTVP